MGKQADGQLHAEKQDIAADPHDAGKDAVLGPHLGVLHILIVFYKFPY